MDKKRRDSQRALRRFKGLLRETPLGGHRKTLWNDPRIHYSDSDGAFEFSDRVESSRRTLPEDFDEFDDLEIN